jgi:hypothetical protein
MTSQEFITWLKGFTEGVHDFNITPKQWDLLKERLDQVSDEPKTIYPFGTPNGTDIPNPAITTVPNGTDKYPWGGQVVWAGTPIDCLRTSTTGYIAPVGQEVPPFTVTSGSSSTAVFPYSGATVTYTVSTGSGLGYNTTTTTSTTNDKILLND